MRICELYGHEGIQCTVAFDGQEVSFLPAPGEDCSNLIRNLRETPNTRGDNSIALSVDPKGWFYALPAQYHGSDLWAAMVEDEADWVDVYYEGLEFFYLEPQHLRSLQKLGRWKHVEEKIHRLEVTLNHQIKHYFALAPSRFRNHLFESIFNREFEGQFGMAGRNYDREYDLRNATQPDFLFTTAHENVAVEMKVKAKSSVSQVLKYALLALAVEKLYGYQRRHSLIILAPSTFSELWIERFGDVESLRIAMQGQAVEFFDRVRERFSGQEERFQDLVNTMEVSFLNYQQFEEFTRAQTTEFADEAGREMYSNMVDGMTQELRRRQLIP